MTYYSQTRTRLTPKQQAERTLALAEKKSANRKEAEVSFVATSAKEIRPEVLLTPAHKVDTVVGTLNVVKGSATDMKNAICDASMSMSLKQLQGLYATEMANHPEWASYRKPTKKAEFVSLFCGQWEEGLRKSKKSAEPKAPKAEPQTIQVKDGVVLTFREAQKYIKDNQLKREGFKATSWAGIRAIIEG